MMRLRSNNPLFFIVFAVILFDGINAKKPAKKEKKMAFNFLSQLKNCEDVENLKINTAGLDPVRFNESVVYLKGDFNVEQDLDLINRFSVYLVITKILASGGKEIVVTYEMTDFCAELLKATTSGTPFTSTANSLGIPNRCPIPPATYTVNNLMCDSKLLQSLKEGEYTMRMEYTMHKVKAPGSNSNPIPELFGCVSVPLAVEPAE